MRVNGSFLLQLDLQFFAEEKTEKATPQKRKETRQKGQVAKSAEVSSSLLLLSFFLFLQFYGPYFAAHILVLFRDIFSSYLLLDVTAANTQKLFGDLTMITGEMVLPILAVLFVVALLSNYFQIGFLFTTENLKFQFKKINPLEGAKRILSIRSLVDLLKNILKIVLIGWTAYFLLHKEIAAFMHLSQLGVTQMIDYLFSVMIKMGISTSAVYTVIGAADFLYQKYDHEKKMKMSLKEIKDEHKKSEGDPLVKGKIKEMQRAMSLNRMMSDVPKADVIITNPTHYAIAIQYDANDGKAPVVIAKGVDFMAQKIKEIARENDIILTENKPLARALYANVEIGQEIPEELFKAVAEILAYVYRLKGKY
ncbi:flagellar biosynthetic protein FlhB [Neobacillus bataviensis LMG 21833]|uniref:Flagellar biosynthetic protein FlhB n=1 Tax=Neobacillus bataviensis LMG 21833 TaxID=1117379 RepID=K6BXN1_9BACI|nr:flagellar biosynthesis protein FlhB [Neobacillus bataviensis]EKN63675.1 flagellar biosynthetic protein FlhB [Neobacillus bataviensis LMG 21833]